MEWIDGEKGPWAGALGIDMVSLGLKCSVDQLLNTGLFHADPHRGNLLREKNGNLAFIDFVSYTYYILSLSSPCTYSLFLMSLIYQGMMSDVTEEERWGLVGLAIGLQNKDLSLITENLLNVSAFFFIHIPSFYKLMLSLFTILWIQQTGFLEDTTQLDELVPRLRQAFINATGGTGKGSDVNFGKLQAELDAISSENLLQFKTPPFFTVIIRSLTILEGFALSVDPNFRLVRGAYPYVLAQLLNPDEDEKTPEALRKLLVRLLTVDGKEEEIEWERLRDFLRLAQKAKKNYNPAEVEYDDGTSEVSRQTIDLFFKFLTSKTGLFLKKPLVHELSEMIDGIASTGEANLFKLSRGLIRPLPGGNGPVNTKRIEEISMLLETIQTAVDGSSSDKESILPMLREVGTILTDEKMRQNARPLLDEVISVFQLVTVEVLEKRGSRAMRSLLSV